MKMLDVYLHQDLVGYLIQNDDGHMVFNYAEDWLNNPCACVLSYSLPLQKERFNRKQCQGFFAGLLPEESKRTLIARNLGISPRNDYAMLEQIGGECAGAVTFISHGEALPIQNPEYRTLSTKALEEILKLLPSRPLLAGSDGIRLSLAGAQDKIAVHILDNGISIPLGGAASTHILKPDFHRFEGLVFNEAFCLELAAVVGLPTAKAHAKNTAGIDYLIIERFDRKTTGEKKIERLHQEDFCQALGVPSQMKYQSEGGPALKDCFALLRAASAAPVIDLQHLLDAVIFNLIIGNHDAHAKNFSLLYDKPGQARLSPLYDLVCTIYYPGLSRKMAMKIGGNYESDKILPLHFKKLADDAQLAKPMVIKRVADLVDMVLMALKTIQTDQPVAQVIAGLIEKRCVRFRDKFQDKL